jgi:hypothetical protein
MARVKESKGQQEQARTASYEEKLFYKEMVIMEDSQPSDSEHHRDFFGLGTTATAYCCA